MKSLADFCTGATSALLTSFMVSGVGSLQTLHQSTRGMLEIEIEIFFKYYQILSNRRSALVLLTGDETAASLSGIFKGTNKRSSCALTH